MKRIQDKIVIGEIIKRNNAVFEALFNEYYVNLVEFSKSYLFDQQISEDLVQEFFIYLWENTSSINIQTSLKAYLYTAVKNRCINKIRDLKVRDQRRLLYIESILKVSDYPVEEIDSDLLNIVKQSIDELPNKMKEVFKLKYLEGMQRIDIAIKMNVSENTIKTQLRKATDKLRKKLLIRTNILFLL